MKYFIFSIDDGTVFDEKVIDIFSRHHIKATFNLNSGLSDFVWYLGERPIERINLKKKADIYKDFDIASHSLTHPHLTQCSGEHIIYEVGQDVDNLEQIFSRKIVTFAFPFEDFDERCIDTIKYIRNIELIRVSEIDTSFKFPNDGYHIKITSLDVEDALRRVKDFINDEEAELFTFVSHGYDFEVNNTYDKLEELCCLLKGEESIKIITMSELKDIFKK